MRNIGFYLITVNSCMNPFVYAFKNKQRTMKRSTAKLTPLKHTT